MKDLHLDAHILTEDLDRLVKTVASEIPPVLRDQQAGSRSDPVKNWVKSVNWAAAAWRTIYIALVARMRVDQRRRYPIGLHPAREFIEKLGLRFSIDPKKAITWLKFQTTYLFARATRQAELPPDVLHDGIPGILAGGWVYRRCQKIMRGGERVFPLALDILLSKYGMPKAPKAFVEKALDDHFEGLSKPATLPCCTTLATAQEQASDIVREWHTDGIKDKIREIVELTIPQRFEESHVFPKPSACFERNTQNGGQIRELVSGFLERVVQSEDFEDNVLVLKARELLRSLGRGPTGDFLTGAYCEHGDHVLWFYRHEREEVLLKGFELYVDALWTSRLDRRLRAKQFGIVEPLKCRVILEAEAAEMLRVTSIQKWMHRHLKAVQAFKYIGTPDDLEDITRTFPPKEGRVFVSGDYNAATDNLKSEFSEYAWKAICHRAGIREDLYLLGLKALTGHQIFRDEPRKGPVCLGNQTNGQSMGSPMSFPILCIINAACFLWSFHKKAEYLRYGPIRINGDDIVFRGKEERYQRWWEVNGVAGLLPSKGKNYISRDFLIINSHAYRYAKGGWFYQKAVNVALAQDLVRKGIYAGRRTNAPWFLQLPNFLHLTRGFPESTGSFLRECFLEHVKIPKGISPTLSVLAGGPGFLLEGEEPSMLARAQNALFHCTRNTFFEQVPRPEDTSYEGKLIQTLLNDHTCRSFVAANVEDPLLDTGWRRERDSVLGGGDLLGKMLLLYDTETMSKQDADVRSAGQFRGALLFPQRDIFEGQSLFYDPRYRRRVFSFERKLEAFYSGSRFERAFPRVGDRRYCTIQPCSIEVASRECGDFRSHKVVKGLRSLTLDVRAFSEC